MLKRLFRWVGVSVAAVCLASLGLTGVSAETSQSANYQLYESAVGLGDMSQSSSANFKAVNSIGDIAIGNSASSNYQIEAGSQTTQYPTLSFKITDGSIDFGAFSPTKGTVTSSTFSVSNYTSYGYVVQIVGTPPKNTDNGHTIDAMTSTGPPQVGIEQFGINLVANTAPESVGANPDNGQFGFGTVASNYNTSNQYRYISGETIAQAPKSSGLTNYTITYLVNVASITAGGQYACNQTVIVTGTY